MAENDSNKRGNTTVGSRGVYVGGNVSGDVITGDNAQVGGIRAGKIIAENVVQGVQQIGGEAKEAAALLELAKALRGGTISADSIEAKNVVSGLQYIADPRQATPEQLRQEVGALGKKVQELIDGEIIDAEDAEDAADELAKTAKELEKPKPDGERVVRRLGNLTDILTKSGAAIDATTELGKKVVALAPLAASVYQVAKHVFGG